MSDKESVPLGAITAIVVAFSLVIAILVDNHRATLCEYSKYATRDYDLINRKLYCRSSDNSFQELTKYKPRSPHLDEHKRSKSDE